MTTCTMRTAIILFVPMVLACSEDQKFTQVSAGTHYACAVAESGELACWGSSAQSGTEPPAGSFTQVSVGDLHACAVRRDGGITCWGNRKVPGQLAGNSFASVSVYEGVACAIRTDRTVVCSSDVEDTEPLDGEFVQITTGASYLSFSSDKLAGTGCALSTSGTIACWGRTAFGDVTPPSGSFRQVGIGTEGTVCGLTTDAAIVCVGPSAGIQGQPAVGSYVDLTVGRYHACGILDGGDVVCWGEGGTRELPQYGFQSQGEAVPPAGTFVDISAGSQHTCGVQSDGRIACWGGNQSGESEPP